MIRTLVLLCLVAAPAFGLWEKGFKVRFDLNPFSIGRSSFMDMPTTLSEATTKGWEEVNKPTLPNGYDVLVLMCRKNDYTLCMLYDDTGYIAGLQIAFDPAKFKGAIYDWTVSGFTTWPVNVNGVTINYQATHQLYISAETLALHPSVRLATRDDKVILQDGQLYLKGFNGALLNVSTNIADLKTSSDYTKQACLLGMGNHYYYKMTTDLVCSAETISTWFPLEYNDQLVGVGFMLPGKYTIERGQLQPFEDPNRAAIKMIVPTGPECLWNYGSNPGVTTMHTYFIKDGHRMNCLW
ncbi:uncharacterized protein LOC142981189 [Anticarsia gemmatalis]|uniref:uncharacterized protein LOC142981189 n=1 Tax=Anticarsia gemmatalis TaxID=129554 RepID=UPI003F763A96